MEYTPISQLKHRFGSLFNSINISLAAVNRKTQLERERERKKNVASVSPQSAWHCWSLRTWSLTKEKVWRKLREFPPKHLPIPGNAVFRYTKNCVWKASRLRRGMDNLNSGFSLVNLMDTDQHNFTTPFTDSKPMIQGPFFGDFGIPSASICSHKTLPGMMT